MTLVKYGLYYQATDPVKLKMLGYEQQCVKRGLQFFKGYAYNAEGDMVYVQDWIDMCVRYTWGKRGSTDLILDDPESIKSALQAMGH